MAVCDYCNQEMLTADGCTDLPISIEGETYPPIRHGEETLFRWPSRPGRCGDCRALAGRVHHHGCDMEECPACGEQSISCGCLWAGEHDDEDDDWPDDPDGLGES